MHDPRAIANLLLRMATERGVKLTNIALQKLLFFAHARALTRYGRALVGGEFEAWTYGPVHPLAYQAFKSEGAKTILRPATKLNPVTREELTVPEPEEMWVRDIVGAVVSDFGNMSAGRLVDITHAPGGPWDRTVKESRCGANVGLRITNTMIREAYGKMKIIVGEKPKIGEPDDDSPLT